jgi:hypothetical protein
MVKHSSSKWIKIFVIALPFFGFIEAFSQNLAVMPMGLDYVDKKIIKSLKSFGLKAKKYSNTDLFSNENNKIIMLNGSQVANLGLFNFDYILMHKSNISNNSISDVCCRQKGVGYGFFSYDRLKEG